MTIILSDLPAWEALNRAQAAAMHPATDMLRDADYSEDPASDYQQAKAASRHLADSGKALAVLKLKRIDAAIAAGPLVADINRAAAKAKKEADLIATATAKVEQLTKVVTGVTQVVAKITALPFV